MRFQSWSRTKPFGDIERFIKGRAGDPKCMMSRKLDSEGLTVGPKHKREAKFRLQQDLRWFVRICLSWLQKVWQVQGQQTQSNRTAAIVTAPRKRVETN